MSTLVEGMADMLLCLSYIPAVNDTKQRGEGEGRRADRVKRGSLRRLRRSGRRVADS